MSNENDPMVPADWRARAFLESNPGAKLDGFEMVRASSLQDPRVIRPKDDEPTSLPPPPAPPKEGYVTADKLAVVVAIEDSVYQFALSKLQRETVLALIAKMHNGQPHLFAQPIENLNVEAFAPKVQ